MTNIDSRAYIKVTAYVLQRARPNPFREEHGYAGAARQQDGRWLGNIGRTAITGNRPKKRLARVEIESWAMIVELGTVGIANPGTRFVLGIVREYFSTQRI